VSLVRSTEEILE